MTRYDLIYTLALPAIAPYLMWRRLTRKKYTESAGGMRGKQLPTGAAARAFQDGSLWIHAVSVGEVAAASAVIPGLRRLTPELPLVLSTITETGQAAARRGFPEDTVTYFPLDFSANVRRFQQVFRPKVFILMETELWPNFLTLAARERDALFHDQRQALGSLVPPLPPDSRDHPAGAQGAERRPAPRLRSMPRGSPRWVSIPRASVWPAIASLIWNSVPLKRRRRLELARALGLGGARRWIVAGSTHPGEEALMLEAFGTLRQAVPDAGLLLCPRHPERFEEAAELARAAGWRTGQASAPDASADPEVIVLDKMGVLARAYGLGEVAIVAGSFCPVGGHNLLEAAAHGVPVLYGPDMHSQREIHRLFKESGAGWQVTAEELGPALRRLLENESDRREEGTQGPGGDRAQPWGRPPRRRSHRRVAGSPARLILVLQNLFIFDPFGENNLCRFSGSGMELYFPLKVIVEPCQFWMSRMSIPRSWSLSKGSGAARNVASC